MTSDTQLSQFLQPCESCSSLSFLGRRRGRAPMHPGILLPSSPANRLRKHPSSDIDSQPEEVTEG